MRLYKQELKRIFMAKRTKVIFLIAIVMSVLLALLASEFNDANVPDGEGNIIELHGNEALQYIKDASSSGNGEVTIESLKEDLQRYQDLYNEYGVDPLKPGRSDDAFPLDVYWDQVCPIRSSLRMMKIAFGTNEREADLMALTQIDIDDFYEFTPIGSCRNMFATGSAGRSTASNAGRTIRRRPPYSQVPTVRASVPDVSRRVTTA